MAPALSEAEVPHIALLPAAGLGHLMPFLRLAESLASRGCAITFVCPTPFVSAAEAHIVSTFVSTFVSSSPSFHLLEFPLPLSQDSRPDRDPFFLQYERISGAAHLLGPILSAVSPPLSAIVMDVFFTSVFVPIARSISLPIYVNSMSNAAMLTLVVTYPGFVASRGTTPLKIPGLTENLPLSSLPQPLRDPKHPWAVQFSDNAKAMPDVDGIVINTWDAFEPETVAALNAGKVVPGLPPMFTVGPFLPIPSSAETPYTAWLEAQPKSSVVYVCFGNRTALPPKQIKELAAGLESSGCRFLWILKKKKVDKDEVQGDKRAMDELLGEGFLDRVEERGMVVRGWVDQQAILEHPAIGGILNHSGWNSLTETALIGVRMLLWPRGGDQRISAMVAEKSGLGEWPREWSWDGDEEIVPGEEIAQRLRALMEEAPTAAAAVAKVKEEALRAIADGGSSDRNFDKLVASFKRGNRRETEA